MRNKIIVFFSAVLGIMAAFSGQAFAAEIQPTMTAELSIPQTQPIQATTNRLGLKISVKNSGRAVNGDYFEFCVDNAPLLVNSLEIPEDIVLEDGTVIGTLEVTKNDDAISIQRYGTEAEKNALEPRGPSRCYKVTFNEAAEAYEDISFTVEQVRYTPFALTVEDYTSTMKVTYNNEILAQEDVQINKTVASSITNTAYPTITQTSFRDHGDQITSTADRFVFTSTIQCKILSGTIITYEFKNGEINFVNPLTAGEIVEFEPNSTYRRSDMVTDKGLYYLGGGNNIKARVVESSSTKASFEILEDTEVPSSFALRSGGLIIANMDAFSPESYRTKMPFTSTIEGSGCSVNYTNSSDVSVAIGSKVAATAKKIQKSVFAKYFDKDGNELAEGTTVIDTQDYGTAYSDKPIKIEGYIYRHLTTTSAPTDGKVIHEDQTIEYVYYPVLPQNQETFVNTTPDPKSFIENFDEYFEGCEAKFKNSIDTSKSGEITVTVVVVCGEQEIEIDATLTIKDQPIVETPSPLEAPHTGYISNKAILAILAGFSTFAVIGSILVKKI